MASGKSRAQSNCTAMPPSARQCVQRARLACPDEVSCAAMLSWLLPCRGRRWPPRLARWTRPRTRRLVEGRDWSCARRRPRATPARGAGQGRQRRRRGGRDRVRARGDAPERRQHRRRRLHGRPHRRTATVDDVRLPREGAAARRRATMYMRDGKVDGSLTSAGYLAPGVPGTVRGLALAHKKFGKLPWKDVVMPARAARGGRVRHVRRRSRADSNSAARRRDGHVPRVGRGLRQARRRHVGRRRSPRAQRISARRSARSRPTGPTRSTRAGSPIASPRTWPPTAA